MSKEKELKAMVVKNDLGKGFKIIETGMQVEILFGMPIPKSLKNVSAGDPHLKRPDIDNLTKYVMDMLNGVVYKDDSQIYTLTVNKMYSKRPLTEIFIYY
jgi:Holliday junction resolvase RusA-like endonuclease